MKLGNTLNIKGAVLDKYQLENYLEKLASDHTLQDKSEKKTYPIPRVEENFKFITKTYDLLNQHLKLGINIHPAGEWLLDNYYIIEETVKEIIQDLPLKKYINFLGISSGTYKGYARIYVLASEIVAYTDGKIDSNNLSNLLKAYQKKKTLNMEEIWNINVFFKIAIIENIRTVCEKMYSSQIQKYKVENILERLIENKEKEQRKFLNLPIPENNVYLEESKYPFIEYMAFRLKKYGKKANIYIDILEEQVEKIGTSISEVIKKEHFDIAIKKVSIGNCIKSIQDLQRINFLEIFEHINGVEEILKKDPANVYEKMDFKTKEYYRNQIKEISKKTKISEIYIAKKVLELANNQKLNEKNNNEKKAHIGYYLISHGKKELMQKLQTNISKKEKEKSAKYILSVYLISMILSIILEYTIYIKSKNMIITIITTLLIFIPITEIVIQVIQYILSKFIKPKLIPKLDLSNGIPEEYRTIVVIPTIVKDVEKVKELFSRLEVFYLANKSENIYFTLLADCTSSDKQSESYDRQIIEAGKEEAKKLNEKYQKESFGKFQFLYRKRTWCSSENSYLGWERKRGLLTQFNEYIVKNINNKNQNKKNKNNNEPFLANTIKDYLENNENEEIQKIKYIITLDADTDLILNSGIELIGAMAHILNKPILNEEKTLVVDGYGIMQPRVRVNLIASKKSLFSEIFAGNGGTDSYTNAISDTYQDNFGEGIYTGKGIYDLEVFEKVLNKAIPENTVLSHDLLEGSYLRCGLVSDILLMDGYPYKYNAFMTRLNRWIRGDWQILQWLGNTVKNKNEEKIANPLNILSKFKILDNLRRSLLEICVILTFLLTSIFNIKGKWLIFTIIFLSILMPTILDLLNAIIFRKDGTKKQKKFDNKIGIIWASILRGIISIIMLPFKAYISLNAIIKTIYRMTSSNEHLLEWTTAEEAEKLSKTDLKTYIKYMIIEVIIGIITLFLSLKTPWIFILSILWITSPYVMYYISKENKKQLENISKSDKDYILELGKNTWNYFKTYINQENNFLPPDNYQEDRIKKVVNRTSSTNIGLGLLSIVSAFDLKYIQLDEAINLIEKMIETIEKLPKWNGHLYNWYNTMSLMPLTPRYISTVDSGNFVGYLYTLNGFLEEIKEKYEDKEKINNLIQIINKMIKDTDFSKLYDREKGIFSIGYNLEEGELTNSYYDLLASEARQASLIAIAKRDIPAKHWNNLSRTLTVLDKYKGLVSWSGTAFEYLMPNINIPRYSGSLLDESCKFMIYSQQKYCQKLGIPWGISESAFNLKDLNSNYQYKAFGIPWLGLKRGLADEMVVSSYGSILAIVDKPNDVIENLKTLEKEGMRGEFGLYESIDYTPNRVKYDKKAVPVKTYMAHHQALILLSINNFINNNILQKRFMSNPEIQTIDILLQENMPENVIITKERKEKIDKIKYLGYNAYSEKVYTKINENLNNYNVIANGEYSVIIDKKGNGFSKYKNIQVNRFKETGSYEQGIYFYVKNVRTKKVWKSVYSSDADEYRAHFMPDIDKFVRKDENIETTTKIIVAPNENVEIRRIELTNKGNLEEIIEVTSVLEPIISTKWQDYAHPTFNNLFLKYSILENNSIFITRNKRGNVEPIYLAVNLFTNSETIGDLEYEIDKDKLYAGGEIDIPKLVKDSKPFSSNTGLVTEPIIALKRTIKILPGETIKLNLIISVSDDEEKAKDNLQMYENNENVERCFELSKARVEEEARYLGITGSDIENFQKVFSYLQFQNPTKKLYINKLPKTTYKQSELWKYGISGDLPILLVRIKDINDINLIKEILKCYEFLRVKNINIDLVILDEEENIYEKYVQDAINNEILSMQLSYVQNISGGIFILNSNEIEDVNLLIFRANLSLEANKGSLKTILNDIEDEYLETIKNIGNDNIKYEIANKNDNNFKIELENLKYYNEYGAFSEDGKEYIIKVNKDISPPTVWSHIIANEKFGTLITNNMGGFTWSKNSRLNRLTVWSNDTIFDTPSEIIYLKDTENGEICSLGSNPIKTNNDYYIIYGFGYAKYIHTDLGIIQEDEIFVPRLDSAKINIIKLKNTMPNKKKLKLYYYIKPVLGEDEIKTNGYIDLQFNKNSNIIYANNLYGEEFSKTFYISSSEKILSYTGSKKEFIGKGTMSNPDGIKKVRLAEENSLGIDSCIVIQIEVELESYETKEISLIIGEEDSILDAQNTAYKYCKLNNCLEELNNVKRFWIDNLSKLQVNTPVESTNIILNGWLVYQTIVSRLWARSAFYQSGGALGFRDQLQDTLGLKYIFEDLMRNQIIKHSKRQFIEGDVEHWWHEETNRGIRTKFSDDFLWLVYVVEEYIELTNNFDILDEVTPYLIGEQLEVNQDEKYDIYNEADIKEDIYNHCIKAIEKSINNFGENNLPKIGTGDWNDGLSTVGNKGKGESVWLGFFLYTVLDRFIPICEKKNDIERMNKYTKIKEELKKSLNTVAWDGRWYKRAFTDDGDVLGSIVNEECKIDNISQAWSVISNAGDNDKKYISMESLENHLIDKENGIIKLLDPPFEKSKLEPGYIKAYLPGVRENGGQYTHAAVWTVIAESILGFGDKAFEYFRMINPIEHSRTVEQAKKYKAEPYVIAADIYGAENLKGRGGWTWYTGSSSWYYKAGIEYILGLRIENRILKIKPCIPKEWKEYSIQYKYGSSTYNIKIKNPNSKNTGVERFIVNGEEIKEKEILLQDNSRIYNIEVYM